MPPGKPRTDVDERSDSDRSSSSADGGSSFHIDEIIVVCDDERPPLSIILTMKSMVISIVLVVREYGITFVF